MAAPTAAAPLSGKLASVVDQLGEYFAGRAGITTTLYATIINARDEAVLLEARAAKRDTQIHNLLDDLRLQCDELVATFVGHDRADKPDKTAILEFDPEARTNRYLDDVNAGGQSSIMSSFIARTGINTPVDHQPV